MAYIYLDLVETAPQTGVFSVLGETDMLRLEDDALILATG
jgi:hypothetical protein